MSPKSKARLVGVLFSGHHGGGESSPRDSSPEDLIVSGDAAATATQHPRAPTALPARFAIYLVEMSCQIAMTVLFYELLKPVSRTASALAAAFGLIGCTIKTLARLFFFAPCSSWAARTT